MFIALDRLPVFRTWVRLIKQLVPWLKFWTQVADDQNYEKRIPRSRKISLLSSRADYPVFAFDFAHFSSRLLDKARSCLSAKNNKTIYEFNNKQDLKVFPNKERRRR